MNRIPLDDCQLEPETINPIKERCHRIFLALVLTGILYVHVEHNQPQMTQTVSPSDPSPILITPINEIAFSAFYNISSLSTDPSIKSIQSNLCQTDETGTLAVTCVNQPNQAMSSH